MGVGEGGDVRWWEFGDVEVVVEECVVIVIFRGELVAGRGRVEYRRRERVVEEFRI